MGDAGEDERAVRELDRVWNDGYERNDRGALVDVLADDFVAIQWNGQLVSKGQLIAAGGSALVTFSELELRMFGSTGVSRGRIRVEQASGVHEQRFVRIYAKRDGRWRAVAVQVFPLAPQ